MMQKQTENIEYKNRLENLSGNWWKRILNVQAPYRWNILRLKPGFTLDLGCGIGRNLKHIDGNGIGVDHNPHSVQHVRSFGYEAYCPDDFHQVAKARAFSFDTILLSHVVEHMTQPQAIELITDYLPYLKKGGKVIFICPQEVGYQSDATHVEFVDFSKMRSLAEKLGLKISKSFSFPFPRWVGRFFKYNEFVQVALKI